MQAAIYGLEGLALSDEERGFFRDAEPAGFILFKRNCGDPGQVLRLTDSLRDLTGRADLPILIDQEGGRVARMRPPEWPAFPAAERSPSSMRWRRLGDRGGALERAGDRADAPRGGLNVDACRCSMSGRRAPATSSATARWARSRCRSRRSGRAVLDGLASAGVVGMIKHMPGHGRALVDSHKELPVVTRERGGSGDRSRAVRAAARRRRWG